MDCFGNKDNWKIEEDILDLHAGHVGGEVQKNILAVLLWAPANVGEKHCLVCPERLVASQEYELHAQNYSVKLFVQGD